MPEPSTKSPKAYQFMFVLYPESQQPAIDYIQANWPCAWALHDKDTHTEQEFLDYGKHHDGNCPDWQIGDLKKPHYHFVVKFKNARYITGVAKEIAVTGKRGKVVAGEECSVFQLCRFVVELTVFIRVAVFTVTFPVITLYSGIGAFSGIAAGARFSLSLFVQRLGAYIENTRHFLYRPWIHSECLSTDHSSCGKLTSNRYHKPSGPVP